MRDGARRVWEASRKRALTVFFRNGQYCSLFSAFSFSPPPSLVHRLRLISLNAGPRVKLHFVVRTWFRDDLVEIESGNRRKRIGPCRFFSIDVDVSDVARLFFFFSGWLLCSSCCRRCFDFFSSFFFLIELEKTTTTTEPLLLLQLPIMRAAAFVAAIAVLFAGPFAAAVGNNTALLQAKNALASVSFKKYY